MEFWLYRLGNSLCGDCIMVDLTIVIPIGNILPLDERFIKENMKYFTKYPTIIVDSTGMGEVLKDIAYKYISVKTDTYNARKIGYVHVNTKYVMNLDSDVLIPEGYIEKALEILEKDNKVGAVTTHFQKEHRHMGIAEFGISIWRKELLDRFYDVTLRYLQETNQCECLYMWKKLERNGYYLEILPNFALHLREVMRNEHTQ